MGGISLWRALLYVKIRSTDGQIVEVEATSELQVEICFPQKKLTTPFLLKVGLQPDIKTRISLK